MSFKSLLDKDVEIQRKASAGEPVEAWVTVATVKGRLSPISAADVQPTAMLIDVSPSHRLYTKDADLRFDDRIIVETKVYKVLRTLVDSKNHHQETEVAEMGS